MYTPIIGWNRLRGEGDKPVWMHGAEEETKEVRISLMDAVVRDDALAVVFMAKRRERSGSCSMPWVGCLLPLTRFHRRLCLHCRHHHLDCHPILILVVCEACARTVVRIMAWSEWNIDGVMAKRRGHVWGIGVFHDCVEEIFRWRREIVVAFSYELLEERKKETEQGGEVKIKVKG